MIHNCGPRVRVGPEAAHRLAHALEVQQITFRLSRMDHQHRGRFGVELQVDVEKHDDFISHADDDDLYTAIDAAVTKSARQLSDFKERLKTGKR